MLEHLEADHEVQRAGGQAQGVRVGEVPAAGRLLLDALQGGVGLVLDHIDLGAERLQRLAQARAHVPHEAAPAAQPRGGARAEGVRLDALDHELVAVGRPAVVPRPLGHRKGEDVVRRLRPPHLPHREQAGAEGGPRKREEPLLGAGPGALAGRPAPAAPRTLR